MYLYNMFFRLSFLLNYIVILNYNKIILKYQRVQIFYMYIVSVYSNLVYQMVTVIKILRLRNVFRSNQTVSKSRLQEYRK